MAFRTKVLAAALAMGGAGPALAQAQGEAALEQVVVTAGRAPQLLAKTPSSIEVVSGAQLERTFGLTFIDQIKKNASLDIIQYPNGLAGVGLRGVRPDFEFTINPRTLVLVDGRPSGSTSFTTISPESIERVEVLKGPASALYGSSAVGGVVNILTKRSKGRPGGTASIGYGSFQTWRGDLTLGGSITPKADFDLGLGYVDQSANFETGDGLVRPNSDFNRASGKARLGADLSPSWRIDGTIDAARLRNNAPGPLSFNPQSRSANETERLGGDVRVEGKLADHALRAVGYASKERYDFWEVPATAPRYRSTRVESRYRGIQLQDTWTAIQPLTLTYGFDWQRVESERLGWTAQAARRAPTSPNELRDTKAVFGEATLTLLDERLVLSAGGRQDWLTVRTLSTPFRPNFTPGEAKFSVFNPRGGAVFRITDALRLHGTAGKAFVPAQGSQLAGEAEEFAGAQRRLTTGNPDLKPERNTSYDFGVGYSRGPIRGDLTYFISKTKDRITTQVLADTPTLRRTSYLNADRSEVKGLEGTLSVDAGVLAGLPEGRVALTTSATRIFDTWERVGAAVTPIRNVARWKANISATISNGSNLSATVTARYDGVRYDTDNSQGRLFTGGRGGLFLYEPFTVVDLSARWNVTRKDALRVELSNLFDKAHYEKADYPMPGRAAYLRYTRAL